MISFLGVILVPVGNFHDDVRSAVRNRLAAQARFWRDSRRFVEFIEFGAGRFVAGLKPFPHDHVHVEQAHTPPHAWSSPALMPSEISRMLPGMPLCPYGIFSGSTSIVLPLGRNVTLYFFVAGLYLTSSMYGLLPPIFLSPAKACFAAKAYSRPRNLAELRRSPPAAGRPCCAPRN